MADFKLRLEISREGIFCYPDVKVACQCVGVEHDYRRYPTLLVEVLSPSTENIDRREKLLNQPTISTVEKFVVIAHDSRKVTFHWRARKRSATCPHRSQSAGRISFAQTFTSLRASL